MGGISLGTDLFMGVGLSVAEAASLGLPFEVLKTYMGGNRGTRTWDAMQHIYRNKGLGGFWNGLYPKMMEATLKGPVLIISKDRSQDFLVAYTKLGTVSAGYIAGFIGGVTQTVVMAPMTFLVTKAVSSSTPQSSSIFKLYQEHGLRGIYTGSSPIAMRQATNWSLRQGFNDFFRLQIVKWRGGPIESGPLKLSKTEEVIAGILSGTCACINQPFEVARIEQQWRQAQSKGKERFSMSKTLSLIYRERGIRGWYAALTPRIALSIWQTLFMVTIARSVRMHMQQAETKVPPRV